jgi:hypothetical protein
MMSDLTPATMPRPTKSNLSRTLDKIAEITGDALDPAPNREDLVRSMKEIAELASGEEEADEESDDE